MSFVMEDTETHNDSMRRVRKRFWREHSQVLPAEGTAMQGHVSMKATIKYKHHLSQRRW